MYRLFMCVCVCVFSWNLFYSCDNFSCLSTCVQCAWQTSINLKHVSQHHYCFSSSPSFRLLFVRVFHSLFGVGPLLILLCSSFYSSCLFLCLSFSLCLYLCLSPTAFVDLYVLYHVWLIKPFHIWIYFSIVISEERNASSVQK